VQRLSIIAERQVPCSQNVFARKGLTRHVDDLLGGTQENNDRHDPTSDTDLPWR
jgi:hypothetical protein